MRIFSIEKNLVNDDEFPPLPIRLTAGGMWNDSIVS